MRFAAMISFFDCRIAIFMMGTNFLRFPIDKHKQYKEKSKKSKLHAKINISSWCVFVLIKVGLSELLL